MLNQSADYALRAVLYVAQNGERRACSADVIATALGVPRNYLGKVLNALTHADVLNAVRGPRGGFRLARPAEQVTLASVVEPFQRLPARRVCLLGDRPCDAATPCSAHRLWQQMTEPVTDFFRDTTVARMLTPTIPRTNGVHHE
ncbi:MAG TPA: Rrf2 family transcriptional regulator [Longimicrobiales bacterium]